uniref:Uncharacterized protein n=1 Tax=Populus trichocarpa TaxID=3694 RepID=B9N6R3_POPTR
MSSGIKKHVNFSERKENIITKTGGLAITCAWKQGVKVTDEPNKTGRSYSQRKAHSRNHDEIPKRSSCRENMQSFPYQGSYRNQVSGVILEVYQVESCQEIQAEKNNM